MLLNCRFCNGFLRQLLQAASFLTILSVVLSGQANETSGVRTFVDAHTAQRPSQMTFKVAVGTAIKQYDDDSEICIGGAEQAGDGLIFINSEPIDFYSGGGIIQPINQWLLPTNNTISIQGFFGTPVYCKIGAFDQNHKLDRVVKKAEFFRHSFDLPQAEEFSGSFNSHLFDLPLLSASARNKTQLELEVTAVVRNLIQAVEVHDGKAVSSILSEGRSIWWKSAFGESYATTATGVSQFYSELNISVKRSSNPLAFIFGKRSILVYSLDERRSPSIFKLRRKVDGPWLNFSKLSFVFADGRLQVWDY